MQMNEEWDGQKGSSAIEIERPFQLLTRDFPIELDESKVPATIPKTKPPEEYKGYQDALEKCAMRKEMNDHAINQCRQDLNDIRNTKPLRFSDCGWKYFKSKAPNSEDGDEFDWESSNNLQEGFSRLRQEKIIYSMDDCAVGKMVVVKANIEIDGQRFWIGKITSKHAIFPEARRQACWEAGTMVNKTNLNLPWLTIHWYSSQKEFGTYRPVTTGNNVRKFGTLPENSFSFVFDFKNDTNTIPPDVQQQLLEDEYICGQSAVAQKESHRKKNTSSAAVADEDEKDLVDSGILSRLSPEEDEEEEEEVTQKRQQSTKKKSRTVSTLSKKKSNIKEKTLSKPHKQSIPRKKRVASIMSDEELQENVEDILND